MTIATQALDAGWTGNDPAGVGLVLVEQSATQLQNSVSVVSMTVDKSITLGAGGYASNLTVTASGNVNGGPNGLDGVYSSNGGILINAGHISGGAGLGGIYYGAGFTAGGTIINTGTIGETSYIGVLITDGRLTNSGSIYGGREFGALVSNNSNIQNYGVINGAAQGTGYGAGYGVRQQGGTFLNTGVISGGSAASVGSTGVYLYGGTLINAGTISGGRYNNGEIGQAVLIGPDAGAMLVIDPGAVFKGEVGNATGGVDLEFAAGRGTVAGNLDMQGTFEGLSKISFNSNRRWTVAGGIGELTSGETITGVNAADTFVLEGFTATSASFVAGAGLELFNGTATETLAITGSFNTSLIHISDVARGTEIVVCYLRGTKIATPDGERAIETLRIGNPVVTKFGGARRIKWIGRQSFGHRFIAGNFERMPVRIKAGALGGGLPRRDLLVSPGHSMLLGKTLVLAKALVNGVTITQDEPVADVHYYLLEFETHDCVLAEGAWSESFADGPGLRNQFHNVDEFLSLYPGYREPDVLTLCAKRPARGAALAAALKPVWSRAAPLVASGPLRGVIDQAGWLIRGWAQDVANPRLPVLLEIIAGDQVIGEVLACDYREDLAAAGIGAGRAQFMFRPKAAAAAGDLRVRRKCDGAEIQPSVVSCQQGVRRAVPLVIGLPARWF